ncbi:MAG: sulfatase [Candidatus Brocadiia bacterium]
MNLPNVVLITCHDLGDHIGPYGEPVSTPNLDEMAKEGVVLENHFSCGCVCSPSRGGLVTGTYPHTNGLMGLVHRGWSLDVEDYPPLPALLAQQGYTTCLFGLQHEHWSVSALGYQEHHGPSGRQHCDLVVPIFTDWLRNLPEQRESPFFAAIGFAETHRFGHAPSHFRRDAYEPASPEDVFVPRYLPDLPEVREDLAHFYGAVNLVDKMVGRIVRTLDETGLSEDTLLVFTSDHGASFMHAKGTLYDGGCKVVAMLRWPGTLPAGRRCEALTSHVDILPSLFRLLGLSMPEEVAAKVQGESFASIVYGGSAIERPYIYAQRNYTNYYDPARMIRSRRFKYIRKGLRTCIFDFVIPELEWCPSGFRKNRRVFEYYPARRCTEELYDLQEDCGEMDNLADKPEHRDKLHQMRAALDEHLQVTEDPFLRLRNDLPMPAHDYEELRDSTR